MKIGYDEEEAALSTIHQNNSVKKSRLQQQENNIRSVSENTNLSDKLMLSAEGENR